MNDTIRDLLKKHAGLPVNVDDLADGADLYAAGLSSFASVQLMLALEEAFEIEFPEEMLNRATFRSASAIAKAVEQLSPGSMAA